jgi:acetolactate synthase-1/2/3 large subunit
VHAVDLPATDFAALGVALGCHGVRVDELDELPGIIDHAFAADRPTVVHLRA